jgi:integrase
MPRMRSTTLEYATQRLKLAPKWIPYPGPTLARGIKLNYRRNAKGPGTWVVRVANSLIPSAASAATKSPYWTKGVGLADDYDKADGVDILNYGQAQDRAKELARGGDAANTGKPSTVDEAIARYEQDLTSRGASPDNARRVRYHMTTALAARPVALLSVDDLRAWRDSLTAKGLSPGTVNRTRIGLRAALEFAAASDRRIQNRDVFRLGLKGLPNATKARRVVLPDTDVLRIVAEAYKEGLPFGLLIHVLAETGARMSQIARVNCADLRSGSRLMVPTSYKGGVGKKKRESVSVPITARLAAALAKARGDRGEDEPLLRNAAGLRWHATRKDKGGQRGPFFDSVRRAHLDPGTITPYALRHSSICRMVRKGVPVTLVAQIHDTSVKEIEAHYGKHLHEISDDIARRGLLQAPDDKVISLPKVA